MDVSGSLGEFGRIRRFFAPLAASPAAFGLTDDAALLGPDRVVTADAIVETVHFLPADPPELVARKLLRVNLSDLAAMGAVPDSYVLTMALPARCDDAWVERFAAGLALDQRQYGICLLGGDSTATPGPITLSVTAFGRLGAAGAVRRAGARPGDRLWVSGTIGDGALGLLAATFRLPGLTGAAERHLLARYRLPEPRVALGPTLAGTVHAMLDVSDGLVGDLAHLCAVSGLAAIIDASAVPVSDAAAEVLAESPGWLDTVLTGGDDYELLCAAPPEATEALVRIATACGTPLTPIGRLEPGDGVRVLDRDGNELEFPRPGYRHA